MVRLVGDYHPPSESFDRGTTRLRNALAKRLLADSGRALETMEEIHRTIYGQPLTIYEETRFLRDYLALRPRKELL